MNLAELGEFGLIHRMAPHFLEQVKDNVLGIGDDCAVIPQNENESLLVTTDLLIEDIHFLRRKIKPRDLGFKSLAVNLSDIAAMGGTPTASFLSLALPREISVDWLDDFFEGLHELSHQTSTPLLGGDTTKSASGVIINIAVLGKAAPERIKYRSTAQPGDVICVTDVLGDSGGGLNILLNNMEDESDADIAHLLRAHYRPRPHLAEGAWLASQPDVHAMLDVSDGIDSDITRIIEASHIGAHVSIDGIPMSTPLQKVSAQFNWNATEIAATSGEDYCLLCTVDASSYKTLDEKFQQRFGRPLYKIGDIVHGDELAYFQQDKKIDFSRRGWDHFK